MKSSTKRIFCALFFAMTAFTVYAGSTWTINGVRYQTTWDDAYAYVIKLTDDESQMYSGDIIIADKVNGFDVKEIGSEAFRSCKNLNSVSIPSSVIVIKSDAFMYSSLPTLTIPASVTELQSNLFWESDLKEITIPKTVKILGNDLFYKNEKLTSVVFEEGLNYIGNGICDGCTALTSVVIPNSIVSSDAHHGEEAFRDCSALKNVVIGNGVTRIGYEMFSGCNALENITLGNKVDSIETWAFGRCFALTKITLPASMTYVGGAAFSECENFTSVTCLATVPPEAYESSFEEVAYANATLYVPKGTLEAYKAAECWKYFKNIVEIGDEPCSLTINDAGHGSSVIKLNDKTTSLSVEFQPETGWSVSSVLYDGTDVTSQLSGNTFTTPAIDHAAILTVVYHDGTSVSKAKAASSDVKISVADNAITVKGAQTGTPINVYTTSGSTIAQAIAAGADTCVPCTTHGVVIIKVGQDTFKVKM